MSQVECCFVEDSVAHVAGRMRARHVGFLPVCNDHGQVIGTITDRDLTVRILADRLSPEIPVQAVMSKGPLTCRAEDPLEDVERLMERYHKWRIVVVDPRRRPVGIISLSDIADAEQYGRTGKLLRDISSRDARVF